MFTENAYRVCMVAIGVATLVATLAVHHIS